ncbi:VCBS repeat-containing protein [Luteimonas aestuarii]|uniref:VCBS repeat-containing protein n=1 Tax=Luteimonas aestuarii TaxID=453837 RepID=A0A4R5TPN5_9GAMM|nr:VCBS repeat-containing protein [Luteimonas aestuarii]TDK20342.1 VCBS repeat-containing protein [Luteimonas aestuarii]
MSWMLILLLATSPFVLQPPGHFHGDEPVVADGDAMLALHDDGERAWLEATRIELRRVADPVMDADDGPETGWQVGPDLGTGLPLAYLRGAGLHAGEVVRAEVVGVDDPAGLAFYKPASVDIRLDDALYRLVAGCDRHDGAPRDRASSLDCHIDLFAPDGGRSRLVAMSGYVDGTGNVGLGADASAALLFAGDLDGDGRLDLLFDTSDHYNVRQPTLFLSREAAEGQPVRAVARHRAVGC